MAHHICTNCTRPTATLYKVYSTPGSIQLTTCQNCGRDVDPYIEREWLLVIMDCVLHRPEAFRHVLYNREPFCDFYPSGRSISGKEDKHKKGSDGSNDSPKDSKSRLFRYSIVALFLRSYLWYMAKGTDREHDGDLMPEIIISITQSAIGELILIMTTILSCSLFFNQTITSQRNGSTKTTEDGSSKTFFYSRLYLALTIPVFFHIATMFALIWENSLTVCFLGTLFVLSLQHMGISVVIEERIRRGKDSSNRGAGDSSKQRSIRAYLMHSLPFFIGILARTIFVYFMREWVVLAIGIDENALECTGIPIPVSHFAGETSFCIV